MRRHRQRARASGVDDVQHRCGGGGAVRLRRNRGRADAATAAAAVFEEGGRVDRSLELLTAEAARAEDSAASAKLSLAEALVRAGKRQEAAAVSEDLQRLLPADEVVSRKEAAGVEGAAGGMGASAAAARLDRSWGGATGREFVAGSCAGKEEGKKEAEKEVKEKKREEEAKGKEVLKV